MMVRVVDVVSLRISHRSGLTKKYLVEFSETLADGRVRGDLYRLPGHKKNPCDNIKTTIDKILQNSLGSLTVNFNYGAMEVFEEEKNESISYPGVKTVYRKMIIPGVIPKTDMSKLGDGDIITKSNGTASSKLFKWLSQKECEKNKVQLREPKRNAQVSALIEPPSGMTEEELRQKLEDCNLDLKKFGQGGAKTLKQFADDLLKGEAILKVHDNRVERVANIVILYLTKEGSNEVLVEKEETLPDGTKHLLDRLPAIKRRPDENEFVAAQKLLKNKLKVDDIHVRLDPKNVKMDEERKESHAYPGITTLYRKHVITGKVPSSLK